MNTQNETDNRPSLKPLFLQEDEDEKENKLPSIEAVRAALEAGADVNEYLCSDDISVTATSLAVEHGNVGLVQLLLGHGADVSGENGFLLMRKSFHAYLWPSSPNMKKSSEEIIQLLFAHGVSPDVRDDDQQSLLMTPEAQYVEVTRLLLEQGADANAQNEYGRTPLCCAASYLGYRQQKTRRELFSLLLDAGADINLCNHCGRSPLMYAVSELDDDELLNTLQYLIERGADPMHCDMYGFSLSDYARYYSVSAKVKRYINQIMNKPINESITDQIFPADSEFDEDEDYDGGNLLHKLMDDWMWEGIFQLNVREKYCAELVRRICVSGIDVNERDRKGRTPLMLAAENWYTSNMISILLEYGADLTPQDANGFTALHYAQFNNASSEVMKLLTPKE